MRRFCLFVNLIFPDPPMNIGVLQLNKGIIYDLLACTFLTVLSVTIVFFLYVGNVPGGADWSTHLSKIRFIVDNLPVFPRWCPESGFGAPFLWDYPPFSYYSVAFIVWIFNLSIFEGCKIFLALILAVGAISTYALAAELGLSRVGRFASGFLLLGSYNIYSWWWIGQLPNVTAVMFTPLALLAFLKAVKKQTFFSIMLYGVSFVPMVLSHLLNTFIFVIILGVTSVVLIILKPELFYISRGVGLPPKYTLRLPKVLFLSTLEAFTLSAWWWLPFLFYTNFARFFASLVGYGVIRAGEGAIAHALKPNSLLEPSLYYAGIGHLLLIIASFGFLIKDRKSFRDTLILPYVWLFVCVFGGISPYLSIPIGLPFRFGPYMSLATSLLGGITLAMCEDFYRRLSKRTLMGLLFALLLLICSVYPSVMQVKQRFGTFNANPSDLVLSLSNIMEKGERLGTGSVGWTNVFSDIWTSYGAAAPSWTNDFAYKFWYFMYYNHTPERVPYFAKNFNVRYFLGPLKQSPYLAKVSEGLYEVIDFNSSLVETTEGKTLVLFIGDETEYVEYFFLSVSATNSSDLLLVYGGKFLEDLDPSILRHFNVIYMSGMFYRDKTAFASILNQYVESEGGLILDTGELADTDIPEQSPVSRVAIKDSTFNLTVANQSEITDGIDLESFSARLRSSRSKILYAFHVRNGAVTLLKDDESPVIVCWKCSAGKVVWTGLNMPYLAMLYNSVQESEMLVKMIRYVSSSSLTGHATVDFNIGTDLISVDVKRASKNTGIWVKMSYYTAWEASASVGNIATKALKIFKAGPNMMLVFPEVDGDYKLVLNYGKTLALQIGEIAAIAGIIAIFASLIIRKWRIPEGWEKTVHAGSGYSMKEPPRKKHHAKPLGLQKNWQQARSRK